MTSTAATGPSSRSRTSIKETLTEVVFAFAMAFIFRGFVIEPFSIPTGSMAPTLLGQHTQHVGTASGYRWTVGPIDDGHAPSKLQQPLSVNEGGGGPFVDPMTRLPITTRAGVPLGAPRRMGDKLFTLKYIDGVFDPQRWDVPVFKYPVNPGENYIKRIVGMPNEQLALVDGDVFSRPTRATWDAATERWVPGEASARSEQGLAAWAGAGWTIARKPERVQRAVWQTIFDSDYAPMGDDYGMPPEGYSPPWLVDASEVSQWRGLELAQRLAHEGAGAARLLWDGRSPQDYYSSRTGYDFGYGLNDKYVYNYPSPPPQAGLSPRRFPVFPVGDLCVELVVEFPQAGGEQSVTVTIEAGQVRHTFRVDAESAALAMAPRDVEAAEAAAAVREVAAARGALLARGRPVRIEAWHVDQAMWLFVDGDLVAGGPVEGAYERSPAERVTSALGAVDPAAFVRGEGTGRGLQNPLANPSAYVGAGLSVEFTGGPFVLHRTRVRRDLYYQPVELAVGPAGLRYMDTATHPDSTPTLGPDQFFLCGDNSPNSADSRRWDRVDVAVASQLDRAVSPLGGPVHRRLLVGKAFVVYLPSLTQVGGPLPVVQNLPMADFGRMRWVW